MTDMSALDAAITKAQSSTYDNDGQRRREGAQEIRRLFLAQQSEADQAAGLRQLLTEKSVEHAREVSDLRYQIAGLERDLEHLSKNVLNLTDADVFDGILASAKAGKNLSEFEVAHLQSLTLLAREGQR